MRAKSSEALTALLLSALVFIGSSEAAIRRGYHGGRGRNSAADTCDNTGADGFYGFGSGSAKVLADCTWDFFRCKGSDACCKQRFDMCCKCVMNPDMCVPTTTPPPTPPTPTPPIINDPTPPPQTCMHPSTLIKCIWRFNGCVENKFYPEPTCYACFDECKMIAMGMADPMQCQCLGGGGGATERPITDIDIPEEQEVIEAPPSPPPRPIIDIDLPEEQTFITAPDDADARRSNIAGGTSSSSWLGSDRRPSDRFSAPVVGQQSQLPRPFQYSPGGRGLHQYQSVYPSVLPVSSPAWRSPVYGAHTPVQGYYYQTYYK